jgi:hypothetical protein
MANDDTPAGFLSRWSRRKADVREGRPLDEPSPDAPLSPATTPTATAPAQTTEPIARPVPTLADAQQLTPESDFTDFMSRGVAPDVKNAAMKKLFADPHFNVMDRMDVYIDDYSQSDPLPMAMLRQMASAQTLGLFDDALETAAKPHTEDASSPMSIKSDAPPSSESDPSNDPTVSDSGEHQDIE